MTVANNEGQSLAKKAAEFRERKLAKAKTAAYLANKELQYWETLTTQKAIDDMKEDDELTERLKESKEHEARRARSERQAKEFDEGFKLFGAFVVGAMCATFATAMFLRG